MKLLIHSGWSKTGTSSFQRTLSDNYLLLKKNGILYPKTSQWLDCAHHDLALAITPHPVLNSNFSLEILLKSLVAELNTSNFNTVIISSELIKNPFENRTFCEFCVSNFDSVELIFVVRRQSELLISLYNQLIRDENLNYIHSLFGCYVDHINFLNFHEVIHEFLTAIPIPYDVKVLNYSSSIVANLCKLLLNNNSTLLNEFSYSISSENKSLPNVYLLALRSINGMGMSIDERRIAVNKLLLKVDVSQLKQRTLFSTFEQKSIDSFYEKSNSSLAKEFLNRSILFEEKEYFDLNVFDDFIVNY